VRRQPRYCAMIATPCRKLLSALSPGRKRQRPERPCQGRFQSSLRIELPGCQQQTLLQVAGRLHAPVRAQQEPIHVIFTVSWLDATHMSMIVLLRLENESRRQHMREEGCKPAIQQRQSRRAVSDNLCGSRNGNFLNPRDVKRIRMQ